MRRIIGIDPGLARTGFGIIEARAGQLRFVDCGVITTGSREAVSARLRVLGDGLEEVLARHMPGEAAIETIFVHVNAASALKLGHARGVALLQINRAGAQIAEYAPNLVKKTVTGTGHAGKEQIRAMIAMLLPGAQIRSNDAADALALAVCHAHTHQPAMRRMGGGS